MRTLQALSQADSKLLYSLFETSVQADLQTLCDSIRESRRLIEQQYPTDQRVQALTRVGQCPQGPESLVLRFMGARAAQGNGMLQRWGARPKQTKPGAKTDEAIITTLAGDMFSFVHEKSGRWGWRPPPEDRAAVAQTLAQARTNLETARNNVQRLATLRSPAGQAKP